MTRLAFLLPLLLAGAAPPRTLVAGGGWAAFDRGATCEAVSRSLLVPPKGQAQPYVTVSFDRARRVAGQLMVAFKRPLRAGSSAVLTIGNQPFLLVVRGDRAWSRGPAQETAILASLRSAGGMRVESRDPAGRRMVDRYLLAGAPTALDAAAAACSRSR